MSQRGEGGVGEALCEVPPDLFKQFPQPTSFNGTDRPDKADSPFEMESKISMTSTVLALPAVTDAVGECGLQPVDFFAREIQAFIRHEPSKILTSPLPHDSGLVVIDSES
jgi:hypothetical protein